MTTQSDLEGHRDVALDFARSLLLESAIHIPREARQMWTRYLSDIVLDGMWTRPTLSLRDRSLATVSALATLRTTDLLRTHVLIAFSQGITRGELCEVMSQVTGYAGMAVGFEGFRVLKEIFETQLEDARIELSEAEASVLSANERLERGQQLMARLWPDRDIGPSSSSEEIVPDWKSWLADVAYGDLWLRPGITLVDRERVTIAILTVLGSEKRLRNHIAAALKLGIPIREIGEEIMHLATYVGFPKASDAMEIAGDIAR